MIARIWKGATRAADADVYEAYIEETGIAHYKRTPGNLGAWILKEGGMPAERIASRSVAFFLIKSSVNFVAVAVLGTVMALGLAGPDLSLWLTALPAAAAVVTALQMIVSRRLNPATPGVVTIGTVHAGSAPNVIPERATLSGTSRGVWSVICPHFLPGCVIL